MNSRTDAFIKKFTSASVSLKTTPENVISIKLRENVTNYEDYNKLIERLVLFAKVKIAPLQGNFQGDAFLITHSREKVILVEHETGLEILYAAGAISTFVGLIPIILQVWKGASKSKRNDRNNYKTFEEYRNIRETDIRYINQIGDLIEEKEIDLFDDKNPNLYMLDWSKQHSVLHRLSKVIDIQNEKIYFLEEHINKLEEQVKKLLNSKTNPKINKIVDK
jgi:hypothetical protein